MEIMKNQWRINMVKSGIFAIMALCSLYTFAAANSPYVHITGTNDAELVISDFTKKKAKFKAVNALVKSNKGMVITFTKEDGSIEVAAPKSGWDLKHYSAFVADIRNNSNKPLSLEGHIARKSNIRGYLHLAPGETGAMIIYLMRGRKAFSDSRKQDFPHMAGKPGGLMEHYKPYKWDSIKFFLLKDLDGTAVNKSITLLNLRGFGANAVLSKAEMKNYSPFIDQYGQFKHENWALKVKSPEDMRRSLALEKTEISQSPRPKEWNKYGGWKNGPVLKATGHFRTQKIDGKWWLVDPEGNLFWSNGICGISYNSNSDLSNGKQEFYQQLPQKYSTKYGANFYVENLKLKYGKNWQQKAKQHVLSRMPSWGINSFGNWSKPDLYQNSSIPYTVPIHTGSARTSEKNLRNYLRKTLAKGTVTKAANDPWLIGYFVDNEIQWKRETMAPELYYRIVREELKRVAPNKLYLGSRSAGHIGVYGGHGNKLDKRAQAAAVKYVDVLSINRYRFSPSDIIMPEGADVPIIIGEYHFGAADRGMLHPAFNGSVGSQEQRYHASKHYIKEALFHPNIVGIHWWTYIDTPLAGTSKQGANFQVGFIDITDTPYPDVINAFKEVGFRLYETRTKAIRSQN